VARERAKAEKLAKFNAKKAKLAADKAAAPAENKEKKEKKEKKKAEPVPEFVYVEETPKGEKKSTLRVLGATMSVQLTATF
jgi:valyl-tRNA synthetase